MKVAIESALGKSATKGGGQLGRAKASAIRCQCDSDGDLDAVRAQADQRLQSCGERCISVVRHRSSVQPTQRIYHRGEDVAMGDGGAFPAGTGVAGADFVASELPRPASSNEGPGGS